LWFYDSSGEPNQEVLVALVFAIVRPFAISARRPARVIAGTELPFGVEIFVQAPALLQINH